MERREGEEKKKKEAMTGYILIVTYLPLYRLLGALLYPPTPSLRNHFHAKKKKYVSSSYLFLCMGSYHHCGAAITFPRYSSVMSRYKGGSFVYIIFSFKHHPLSGRIERSFYVLSTKKSQL